jgi:thiosulfate dehydrogenase
VEGPGSILDPKNRRRKIDSYGHDLIAHTSVFLGPKGKVRSISNGLNCQNCHLAGRYRPLWEQLRQSGGSYPKFRHRSGTVEGVEKRINDCLERSLNGQKLNADSKEMNAMISYIKWVGQGVEY